MRGVAIGPSALFSATSIIGGFGHDLNRKTLGHTPHIAVYVTRPGGFGEEPAFKDLAYLDIVSPGYRDVERLCHV
jgi:ABC-type lipoprotein release transport system permease subunit